jgi:hypothetical protein
LCRNLFPLTFECFIVKWSRHLNDLEEFLIRNAQERPNDEMYFG